MIVYGIEKHGKEWHVYGIDNKLRGLWCIRTTKEDAIRAKKCLESPIL